ncbi:unnamed protein product [Schistosoma curassoni]|uniref:Uncharacterized protein n=1 Tax=Schistosoma curassoni TaxID=6186 RepID=A0A183KEK1_9TREM|nr:unnamed protein product [Schistosoma curassoni]
MSTNYHSEWNLYFVNAHLPAIRINFQSSITKREEFI